MKLSNFFNISNHCSIAMSTLWVYFFLCFRYSETAKILGFFPFPSISHQIIFQSLWRELSLQGHEVTVITPNPLKDRSLTNLTEIDMQYAYEVLYEKKFSSNMGKSKWQFSKVFFVHDLLMDVTEVGIQHEDALKLLKYDNENHFDLLLVQSLHPLMYIFAAKFKAPIVGLSSLELFLEFYDATGNPTHPVVSPDPVYNSFDGELSFIDRVNTFLFQFWYRIVYYWHILPAADHTARKYLGREMPNLDDLIRNTSIFLVNVNCIIHKVRANVPNVIPVSQMHIRKRKPLPKDLQEFLDTSTEGVIYFSLGSNVKSANLSINTREAIIQAFETLPYKVLWKWESDYIPDLPNNVLTRKWLPQQDLLGHPNIKLFITQGGIQSAEEAIANEVPIIGLPFISDQSANIKNMVKWGMGLGLHPHTLTKISLRNAILAVTTNETFKTRVKDAKAILTDYPLKGVDKAVWWVEYVLRHQGASHLRSEAANMTFFEYFMIDVVLFVLICSFISLFIFLYFANVSIKAVLCTFKSSKHKID